MGFWKNVQLKSLQSLTPEVYQARKLIDQQKKINEKFLLTRYNKPNKLDI